MVKMRHALLVGSLAAVLTAFAARCTDPGDSCDVADPMICGDNRCVDLLSDPGNCGSCGASCSPGTCQSGFCVCGGRTCGRGDVCCSGACAALQTDRNNCGRCGIVCPSGVACTAGVCAGEACPGGCTGGTTCCGVSCADTDVDRSNCGSCGHTCDTGEICESGACIVSACAPPCTLPERCCGDACTDVTSDTANCGYCGNDCLTGDPPGADSCVQDATTERIHCSCHGSADRCRTGQLCCENGCKTVASDRDNCGACGVICDPLVTNACTEGECVCGDTGGPCPTGSNCCPDAEGVRSCVDTTDDIHNCGGCGNECSGRLVDSCTDGECTCGTNPQCRRGPGICGGDPGLAEFCCSGTCTPVDETNCASCGEACDTAAGQICESVTPPLAAPCTFVCTP